MVSDDESLDSQTFGNHLEHVSRCRGSFGCVVGRNHAAFDAAAKVVHVVDGGFEVIAADIVKVHVDAVRSMLGEFLAKVVNFFVVDDRIDAGFVLEPLDLFLFAGTADHATIHGFGQLANDGTDGPGRR